MKPAEPILIETADEGARSPAHDAAKDKRRNPRTEVKLECRVETVGDHNKVLAILDEAGDLERSGARVEEHVLPRADERGGCPGNGPLFLQVAAMLG